jgi:hypothetical protein
LTRRLLQSMQPCLDLVCGLRRFDNSSSATWSKGLMGVFFACEEEQRLFGGYRLLKSQVTVIRESENRV